MYLQEDCPAMLGNRVKPAQGKPKRNQGMLMGFFSNGNYCHGSLEVLYPYVGKIYEKISLKILGYMAQPIFSKVISSNPSNKRFRSYLRYDSVGRLGEKIE